MIFEQAKIKSTIDDYENLPEGARYQFIDSEIIEMSSPSIEHQNTAGNLFFLIKLFLTTNKIGQVFIAPMDVQVDQENILQPDIVFVANFQSDIIKKKRIYGSPALVIEVLSDSTAYFDLKKKKNINEKVGIQEYWIVDIETKSIDILNLLANKEYHLTQIFKESIIFNSSVLPGFNPSIEEIFG